MPAVRAAGGAVGVGDKLYVVAGVGLNGIADRTFVYEPSAGSWDEFPGPPTPREHLGIATDGRVIYAIGGRVQGRLLDAFEALDPDSGQSTVLADLPTPRGGMAATVTESGIVVAAGGESSNGTFSEVEVYVPARDQWVVGSERVRRSGTWVTNTSCRRSRSPSRRGGRPLPRKSATIELDGVTSAEVPIQCTRRHAPYRAT